MALLRGLPDRGHRGGGASRAGAGDRRRPPRPRRRWPRRSPTAPRSCWSARPTTRPARRSPRPSSTRSWPPCPSTCWWWSTRPTSSSCGWTTAVDGLATYRAHPNVVLFRTFSKAYGLAGFRVGYAVAHGAGGRRAARRLAAVRRLGRRPGRGDRVARAPRPSCSSGSRRWWPSATGWSPGCATPAGTSPSRRATSSGSGSGSAPLEFAAAADEAGIVVRPFAGEGARVSHRRARGQRPRSIEVAGRFSRCRGLRAVRSAVDLAPARVERRAAWWPRSRPTPHDQQRDGQARSRRPGSRRAARRTASARSTIAVGQRGDPADQRRGDPLEDHRAEDRVEEPGREAAGHEHDREDRPERGVERQRPRTAGAPATRNADQVGRVPRQPRRRRRPRRASPSAEAPLKRAKSRPSAPRAAAGLDAPTPAPAPPPRRGRAGWSARPSP